MMTDKKKHEHHRQTKDDRLFAALEAVAESLGAKVSVEKIKKETGRQPKGGLCHVAGEPRIIVHRDLSPAEKVNIMIEALQGFDLEGVFIPPEAREAIEGSPLLKLPQEQA